MLQRVLEIPPFGKNQGKYLIIIGLWIKNWSEKMAKNDEMDVFEKYETCKYSDDLWCYKGRRTFLGRLFRHKHNVGVNSYSIKCHCENCTAYIPKEGG